MTQETIASPTQMPAGERFTVANELMGSLGDKLEHHRDYRRVVARATLSVIPGEAARLAEGPVIFRNRGNLYTLEHRVSGVSRRMELEVYEGRKGKPLKWADRVVLATQSIDGEVNGSVHYHKEVMNGEDPEPLNNSPEAIAAVRRVISQL